MLSENNKTLIVQDYLGKKSLDAIGTRFGVSRQRIFQILCDAQVHRPPLRDGSIGRAKARAKELARTQKVKSIDKVCKKIIKFRDKGLSWQQVANKLNIPMSRLFYIRQRYIPKSIGLRWSWKSRIIK